MRCWINIAFTWRLRKVMEKNYQAAGSSAEILTWNPIKKNSGTLSLPCTSKTLLCNTNISPSIYFVPLFT